MQSAAKRSGATIDVNYKKQDIYDLWKVFYHKVMIGDTKDLDKVKEGINNQVEHVITKMDMGNIVVILDASRSMAGSEERPLHPFLTSLSIISSLDNVEDVIMVGGKKQQINTSDYTIIPSGATDLSKGLIEAVKTGNKKIILISDGYENSVKGMFEHVYKHFKESDPLLDLVHINPVMAADAKEGTTRCLVEGIKPLPISSHKFLETELLFTKMLDNRSMVKQLLVTKYKKLIGG